LRRVLPVRKPRDGKLGFPDRRLRGSGHDEDRRRAIEAGFNHHMDKTVDLDVLQPFMTRSDPAAPTSPGRAARSPHF
jgi:hypothetical protein